MGDILPGGSEFSGGIDPSLLFLKALYYEEKKILHISLIPHIIQENDDLGVKFHLLQHTHGRKSNIASSFPLQFLPL